MFNPHVRALVLTMAVIVSTPPVQASEIKPLLERGEKLLAEGAIEPALFSSNSSRSS